MFAEVRLPSRYMGGDDNKTIKIDFCFDTGSSVFTLWTQDLANLGWNNIDTLVTDYGGHESRGKWITAGGNFDRIFIFVEKRLRVKDNGVWVNSDWFEERAAVGDRLASIPRLSGRNLKNEYNFAMKKCKVKLLASQTDADLMSHYPTF